MYYLGDMWGATLCLNGLSTAGKTVYLQTITSPLGGDDGRLWSEIYGRISELLKSPTVRHVVYYPAQPLRRRVYLHGTTVRGEKILVKIEHGATSEGLDNEGEFLNASRTKSHIFSLPTLRAALLEPAYRILIFDEFPHGFSSRSLPCEIAPFSARNQVLGVVNRR